MSVSAADLMRTPHRSSRSGRARGLSLIELMVTMAIGLVVMAGVLGLVSNSLRANADSMKTTRLNQEMRAAMDLMVRDIRRAGYRKNYADYIGSIVTGGIFDNTVRIVHNGKVAPQGGHIEFQYDLDDDGTLGTTNESFGFRLDTAAGVIRYTTSALAGTPTWQALTDPNVIQVTELSFCLWPGATATDCPTEVPTAAKAVLPGSARVSVYTVRITLKAQLRNDPSTLRTLTENVRVRNDRFDNAS